MTATTKLKHADRKGTIEVRADQVDMYKSQGWVEADAPKSAAEKAAEK